MIERRDSITTISTSISQISVKDKAKESLFADKKKTVSQLSVKELCSAIAEQLQEIIDLNSENANVDEEFVEVINEQKRVIFFSQVIPNISISNYIERLVKFSVREKSTIIMIGILIDRFCDESTFVLTLNNVYRVILAAYTCAIKYNEDKTIYHTLNFISKLGGVSKMEIEKLEYLFLESINYKLFIKTSEYITCGNFILDTLKNNSNENHNSNNTVNTNNTNNTNKNIEMLDLY